MSITPLDIKQQITTTTKTTITITPQQVLEMLRERLSDPDIPIDTVELTLLEKGTYHGYSYDFGNEPIISITYRTESTN